LHPAKKGTIVAGKKVKADWRIWEEKRRQEKKKKESQNGRALGVIQEKERWQGGRGSRRGEIISKFKEKREF